MIKWCQENKNNEKKELYTKRMVDSLLRHSLTTGTSIRIDSKKQGMKYKVDVNIYCESLQGTVQF